MKNLLELGFDLAHAVPCLKELSGLADCEGGAKKGGGGKSVYFY